MIVRTGASTSTDARTAARELHAAIGAPKAALAVFYAAPTYDLDVLGAELARLFEGVHLIGCTTAGEITPLGYMNGALTGVSLESPDLVVESAVLDSLREFQFLRGEAVAKRSPTPSSDGGSRPRRRTPSASCSSTGCATRRRRSSRRSRARSRTSASSAAPPATVRASSGPSRTTTAPSTRTTRSSRWSRRATRSSSSRPSTS